ncbi:MAG: exodeoxyribonuclease VII large subunit, partial [Parachlamydiaceae bacterium]|nr:exodeoxyribonuclease VII large subunit [Parachlamydiaceae bacterium]
MQSPPVLTVTQITHAIKQSLESSFRHVWLQGEISNFKAQGSGHLYFSLKDQGAQIGAVMFRSEAAAIKIPPKDGAQVIIRGEINVYPQSGKYQIVVRELRYVGLGELLVKLEELKAKLYAKGWFNPQLKKPLPKFPKTIGVVTSPTGAVIQDILNVLQRRYPGFHLILNPVRVQGEGAAAEIALAINQFNRYALADVLIVGRGGGSIEDLWAFNEEIVAEAIFNSKIPIISAVGHETDVCLTDFVADARAPTPSAAATMVIADKAQVQHHLGQVRHRLMQSLV